MKKQHLSGLLQQKVCGYICAFPDAEGIIEDVVILGAPVPASSVEWKKFSRIVAGTIVNGYCR